MLLKRKMDKAIEDLHYRFEQISECIKNQQNKTALLVLEELKDVITQDYLRFQHIYLTLQEAYPDTTNTQQFTEVRNMKSEVRRRRNSDSAEVIPLTKVRGFKNESV